MPPHQTPRSWRYVATSVSPTEKATRADSSAQALELCRGIEKFQLLRTKERSGKRCSICRSCHPPPKELPVLLAGDFNTERAGWGGGEDSFLRQPTSQTSNKYPAGSGRQATDAAPDDPPSFVGKVLHERGFHSAFSAAVGYEPAITHCNHRGEQWSSDMLLARPSIDFDWCVETAFLLPWGRTTPLSFHAQPLRRHCQWVRHIHWLSGPISAIIVQSRHTFSWCTETERNLSQPQPLPLVSSLRTTGGSGRGSEVIFTPVIFFYRGTIVCRIVQQLLLW